jgi:hypothetical protein
MDDTTKYVIPSDGDCDTLTPAGEVALRLWARDYLVADESAEMFVDELWDDLPEWAQSISTEDFARVARVTYDGVNYFRARRNDGLGAVTSPIEEWTPTRTSYLVDGLVSDASVNMIVGDSGTLKSWLAASLLVSLSHRRPWLGHDLHISPDDSRRLVYDDYEQGQEELDRRLRVLGANGSKYPITRVCHPSAHLDDDRLWQGLERLDPMVVILDSLSSGHPSIDEKDARFANPLRRAAAFAAAHRCTFFFIHHSPKDTSGGNVIRGTGATYAALDECYLVERTRGENTARVTPCKGRRGQIAPFAFRLDDRAGLVVVDPKQKSPAAPTKDEKAIELIRRGESDRAIAKELHIRHTRVAELRKKIDVPEGASRTPASHEIGTHFGDAPT